MSYVQIRMIPVKIPTQEQETHELQLLVCGHAGYAEKGNDIVCAAESILVQMLAASLTTFEQEMLYDFNVEGVTGSGCACITATPTAAGWERARGLFEGVATGFYLLSCNYPKHIQLSVKNMKDEHSKQSEQNKEEQHCA